MDTQVPENLACETEAAGEALPRKAGLSREARLAALRGTIARLENRPLGQALEQGMERKALPFQSVPAGLLHEIWSDHFSMAANGLGFALGLAKDQLRAERPVVLWLQLAHEGQEFGLPYGPALRAFGLPAENLILGRLRSITDLLWAAEEAAECPALAAVIADIGSSHKMLDFTASRRLSLRAEATGTSLLLVRYGREREASAAAYRWHVAPTLSEPHAFDDRAPGETLWQLTLEKGGRSLMDGKETSGWIVKWTDHGFVSVPKAAPGRRRTPLPGALPATMGDRLSQTA